MKYIASFLGQAWVGDYALAVDPQGPTTWDVTDWMMNLTPEQRQAVLGQEDDPWDFNDHLQGHPDAPAWVKGWSGPFEITVTEEA